MGYPGSKGGPGVWQRIISQMPAHENYAELFLPRARTDQTEARPLGLAICADDGR